MPSHISFQGQLLDIDANLREIERWDSEESLAHFLKTFWKYIDPAEFKDGWVIDAICDHLQAVVDGEIRHLILNIPPRTLKSSLCSVAFPAWVWAQRLRSHTSGPGVKFLYASYAERLSKRDSARCRRVIDSPLYQHYWSDRFTINPDQNTVQRFSNTVGGERLITSIGTSATGDGGDIIVIDDPNAADDAENEEAASIEKTLEWWHGTMPTRLNDQDKSCYIVVQQRIAENDLTGDILSNNMDDWTHVMIPMRYEWERHSVTSIGWNDPRGCDDDGEPLVVVDESGERQPRDEDAIEALKEREGTLMWPERFSDTAIASLEGRLLEWRTAGQLQQSPMPKGGGIIKREWWLNWKDEFPPFSYILAFLDTAYTEKTENDPSAITVWGVFQHDMVAHYPQGVLNVAQRTYTMQSPKVMLIDAWSDRLPIHKLVNRVAKTCTLRKVDKLLIENKASGISVSQELRRLFANEPWSVQLSDPKSLDKMARLYSVQHMFVEGMVFAPDREYVEPVIAECEVFPKGKHDDLADTTSGALRHLRDLGLLQRPPEVRYDLEEDMRHGMQRAPSPLYPS